MPTTASDPSRSDTLSVRLADVRVGWDRAYIPIDERRALLLRYATDLTQADVGRRLGVTQKTISERLARGVGRPVAYLNGALAE